MRRSADAATSVGEQASEIGLGAGVNGVATGLPGSESATAATKLADAWQQRLGTWAADIRGFRESVSTAANRYAASDEAAEVGRRIAIANPDASREELADLVAEAVTNSETVVIPEGGGLAFSDQIEPDETGEPALPAPEKGQDPDSDSTGSGKSGSGSRSGS